MAAHIHPLACVDPAAKLADNVTIGPWSWIGPDVEIGEGTIVGPHVVIKGPARIGKDNRFYSFSSIGEDTQDLKYQGEKTWLEMGDRNTIREYVSIHRGTEQGGGLTKLGSDNLLVTYSHVAHDCIIGNNTIIGHHVGLAGHVQVGDYAILSGYSAVHQFCHIGEHVFLGRLTMLVQDVPPFLLVAGGNEARAVSINVEGLKRRGFSADDLKQLKRAYKALYRQRLTLSEAEAELKGMVTHCAAIQSMLDFIAASGRGILRE
jgi:UDP-N-acetylglucosamine acyltransferase